MAPQNGTRCICPCCTGCFVLLSHRPPLPPESAKPYFASLCGAQTSTVPGDSGCLFTYVVRDKLTKDCFILGLQIFPRSRVMLFMHNFSIYSDITTDAKYLTPAHYYWSIQYIIQSENCHKAQTASVRIPNVVYRNCTLYKGEDAKNHTLV